LISCPLLERHLKGGIAAGSSYTTRPQKPDMKTLQAGTAAFDVFATSRWSPDRERKAAGAPGDRTPARWEAAGRRFLWIIGNNCPFRDSMGAH
jgi:hypothetical protein